MKASQPRQCHYCHPHCPPRIAGSHSSVFCHQIVVYLSRIIYNGITQYVLFLVCCLSPSVIISTLIHAVVCTRGLTGIPLYKITTICLPTRPWGASGVLPVLALTNKAAWTFVGKSLCGQILFLLRKCFGSLGMQRPDHTVGAHVTFWEVAKIFPSVVGPFYIPASEADKFQSLHILTNTWVMQMSVAWCPRGFDFSFPYDQCCHLFICCYLHIFIDELFQIFCPLKKLFYFCWILRVFHILWIQILYQIRGL